MKKNYLFLIATMLLSSIIILGQAPQKIDFQAMARDGSGNPLLHQTIGVRISVKQGSNTVYTERHTPQTDDYGLFMLHIGDGTPLSGDFSTINWSLGNHSVKVEVDPDGGYVYRNMGTSILTSSPYAFYGEDDDANPINELQSLSISGNDLTISEGNTVTLPTGGGTSPWQQNGDDIYYEDGNVGIGDSEPAYALHVKDSPNDWLVGIHNTNGYPDAHGLVVRADGGDPFLVQNSNYNLLIIKDDGNVGIGTTTPDEVLHVEDHIRVGEDLNYPMVYGELYHEGGGNGFHINAHAGGGTWADMYFQTNGSTRMFIESSGKVGVGTTTPSAKLDVNGTTKIGVSGSIFSEIREITGNTITGVVMNFSYPSGYNKTNMRVLSLEIYASNSDWVSMGTTSGADPNTTAVHTDLGSSYIWIFYPNTPSYHNKPFRMIVMKME